MGRRISRPERYRDRHPQLPVKKQNSIGQQKEEGLFLKTNYVFIDYENIQPDNLAILKSHPFKVMVFVGSNQTKIPFDLAASLQELGGNAEYIKIEGNGSNSLDFHIAYYIGRLAERDKESFFHIISQDKGFDPLIRHLKSKKIYAKREKDVSEIPCLSVNGASSKKEKVEAVVSFCCGKAVFGFPLQFTVSL
jgi:hypothetical protein